MCESSLRVNSDRKNRRNKNNSTDLPKGKNENIKYLVVDLFAGAGGTSTGFDLARRRGRRFVKVIACVNHDHKAIQSHWVNHPKVKHFNEDIRTLRLQDLIDIVNEYRLKYPKAKLILWGSLECTNFSKAKGGLPRDADSRTLAYFMYRYIRAIHPDFIMIENVEEFKKWGEQLPDGSYCNDGKCFDGWRNHIKKKYNYVDRWAILNSADFGAYTSRKRLFGCFARTENEIIFPIPTHSKKDETKQKWKAVKEVLDFNDEGQSIFNRKKPLSENTLKRIYAGLEKFIPNGEPTFIKNYKSGGDSSKCTSLYNPIGTITTVPTQAIVTSHILKFNSVSKKGKHIPPSVDEPCPTIATQNRLGLVNTFLSTYYGHGSNTDVDAPCPTLTTKDRISQVSSFIYRDFGSVTNSSIENPAGAITNNPKMNLVNSEFFLYNPQFGNKGSSVNKPCFALIAQMGKKPPSLIKAVKSGKIIDIKDRSEWADKIVAFMLKWGIHDIKMRMLRIPELLRIQGFPSDYELMGTQTEQKKFIGNSVVPQVVRAWIEAM